MSLVLGSYSAVEYVDDDKQYLYHIVDTPFIIDFEWKLMFGDIKLNNHSAIVLVPNHTEPRRNRVYFMKL